MLGVLIEAGIAAAQLSDQALQQMRTAMDLLARPEVQADTEAVAKLKQTVTLNLEALRNVAAALAEVNAVLGEQPISGLEKGDRGQVVPLPLSRSGT